MCSAQSQRTKRANSGSRKQGFRLPEVKLIPRETESQIWLFRKICISSYCRYCHICVSFG